MYARRMRVVQGIAVFLVLSFVAAVMIGKYLRWRDRR